MRNPLKTTLAALAFLALIPAGRDRAHRQGALHRATVTATTLLLERQLPRRGRHLQRQRVRLLGRGDGRGGLGLLERDHPHHRHYGATATAAATRTRRSTSGRTATFRQIWHFNKTATSVDKTCDRCQIGDEGGTGNATGPHTHLQYDLNGTNDTSWYSGYTTKGEFLDRGETVGYVG